MPPVPNAPPSPNAGENIEATWGQRVVSYLQETIAGKVTDIGQLFIGSSASAVETLNPPTDGNSHVLHHSGTSSTKPNWKREDEVTPALVRRIHISDDAPTSSEGEVGDLWLER